MERLLILTNYETKKVAIKILQENGSRITGFQYDSYKILKGKPLLKGLPSSYVENEDEASTLEIKLVDEVISCNLYLIYTVYEGRSVITRNARVENFGGKS